MEWFGPLRSDDDRRRQFEPRKRLPYVPLFVWRYRAALVAWIFYRRVDRCGAGLWRDRRYCLRYCPMHFLRLLTLFVVSLLAHLLRGTRL
jgi:hypothetical protein